MEGNKFKKNEKCASRNIIEQTVGSFKLYDESQEKMVITRTYMLRFRLNKIFYINT